MIKKKSIILIISAFILAASTFAATKVNVATATYPATAEESFVEDFESYAVKKYGNQGMLEGDRKWSVYTNNESQMHTAVIEDPTGANRGKVFNLGDTPTSAGYANLEYNVDSRGMYFNARNYTLEYDFYTYETDSSGWIGNLVRNQNYYAPFPSCTAGLIAVQKGKGVDSDVVTEADGSTRSANSADVYYQFQAFNSMSQLRDDSGILKDLGRYYKVGGGNLGNTWFTFKAELKDDTVSVYLKLAEESEDKYQCLGRANFLDEKGSIWAGGLAFSVCLDDYYIDNVRFTSEDDYPVSLVNTEEGKGTVTCLQSTGGEASVLKFIASAANGCRFDALYTDSALTGKAVPKSIKLEKRQYNRAFGVYEWNEVEGVELKTFEDLTAAIDEDTLFYDLYNGEEYRYEITVEAKVNGFGYYAVFKESDFKTRIYSDGNGTVTATGFDADEQGVTRFRFPKNDSITLIAEPSAGFKFAGWFEITSDGEGEYVERIAESDEFLYTLAKNAVIKGCFIEESAAEAKITLDKEITKENSAEYGSVRGAGKYFVGVEITLFADEMPGFAFIGWYDADGELVSEESKYNITVAENAFYKALFEVEAYRIFISNGFFDSRVQEVENNSEVTLTAVHAPVGYEFAGWTVYGINEYVTDAEARTITFIASERRIEVKAEYVTKVNKVKITTEDVNKGAALGAGNYKFGSVVKITPTMKEGYDISRYYVVGVDTITVNADGSCSFVMPDRDVTVRVEFVKIDVVNLNKEIPVIIVCSVLVTGLAAAIIFASKKKEN